MPQLPRDPRAPHDQVIQHDLHLLDERKLLALLVVEIRKLRQQLFDDAHPEKAS